MPYKLFSTLLFLLCQMIFGTSQVYANSSSKLVDVNELNEHQQSLEFDLRDRKWFQGELFELKGYWNFGWQTFLSKEPNSNLYWTRVHVPGSWDQSYSTGPSPAEALPGKGYGTYWIRILVPQDLKTAYLYLPDMASAYELWYQNQRIGGNGIIGREKTSEQPAYLPKTYALQPQDGVIELFIKTSNFHYKWGGIWYAPKLTDGTGLFKLRDQPLMSAISGGTMLLMAAVFSLLLFASRPQTKKTLYFGLFCLAIGIRRLLIDERILYMGGYFDWQTLQAAENITMYLLLPLFLAYFREVFPSTTHRHMPLIGWLVAMPLCVIALFTEVEFYAHLNLPFQAALLLIIPIVLHNWFKALMCKIQSAKIFGLSLLILLITIVNDILHYNYVIETTNLMHIGALAFVLFQIAALMQRYLKNFRKIEGLSESLSKQNKELLKLDQFKDDFLASTSHELRMPLHGIAGLAKTVRQEQQKELSAGASKKVHLIESTAQRLSNIVNDILDIASIKHDKLDLHLSSVQLEPIVQASLETLQPTLKGKPLELSCHIESDAKFVRADEQRLHQILFNLVGNSVKFTESGQIKVCAQKAGQFVKVSVSDTGIGIPKSKLDAVFNSFETFDSGAQNEIRGTGLGLAITKRLVELQGGAIQIDSQASVGTTVSFTLPLELGNTTDLEPTDSKSILPTLPEAQTSNYSETSQSLKKDNNEIEGKGIHALSYGAHIFFADDEEMNRELLSAQLQAAGYQLSLFPNGSELLSALETKQPDLILLDWMMPNTNGLEACIEIRKRYNTSELPIMMLTAKHQPDEITRALSAGANDYLTKPHHEQELLARVSGLISVKKLSIIALENERLNTEISQQTIQKEKLERSNHRLLLTLNHTDSGVLLMNDELDIIFANQEAEKSLQIMLSENEEPELEDVLGLEASRKLQDFSNQHLEDSFQLEIQDAHNQRVLATVNKIRDGDETLLALFVTQETAQDTDNPASPDDSILHSLVREMADNRQRMDQLESTIQTLKALEKQEPMSEEPVDDPKTLVVRTLKTSLLTWERHTHKNKADLAEQSRCWRVYLDGTTAKTRTMDKYLSVKTLPAKPRWRAVIKTAKFVLDHCEVDAVEESELNSLIEQLKQVFA